MLLHNYTQRFIWMLDLPGGKSNIQICGACVDVKLNT